MAALPRPRRSRSRRRTLTLVAGFKCWGGVVLSADTQETAEDLKSYVEKLEVYDKPWCQIGMAGSGTAELVELLVNNIKEELDHRKPVKHKKVHKLIESVLVAAYRETGAIGTYPVEKEEDKRVVLLIAARPAKEDQVSLWKSTASVLNPVNGFSVIGVGEVVNYIAENCYRTDITLNQAVLLSNHLLHLAKKYVDGVGGENHSLVVTDEGNIRKESLIDTEHRERFYTEFNKAVGELTLSCPDTSMPPHMIRDKLNRFVEQVWELRQQLAEGLIEQSDEDDIYPKFPKITYLPLDYGEDRPASDEELKKPKTILKS